MNTFDLIAKKIYEAAEAKVWPDKKDVDFARNVGFGYGSPVEPFLNAEKAATRQLDTVDEELAFLNASTFPKLESRPVSQKLADLYSEVALAAKRSPILSLGFDPRSAVAGNAPEELTIRGSYTPSEDTIFHKSKTPYTLAHESIHRGIEKLKRTYPTNDTVQSLNYWENELLTRYMMDYYWPDHELRSGSNVEQIEAARKSSSKFNAIMNELEALAAETIKNTTPGGPR